MALQTELSQAHAAREAAEAKVIALKQELEAFRSGTQAPVGAGGSDLGATNSDTLDELGWHLAFDTIDDNGDGVLSLEEFRSRLAAGFEPRQSRDHGGTQLTAARAPLQRVTRCSKMTRSPRCSSRSMTTATACSHATSSCRAMRFLQTTPARARPPSVRRSRVLCARQRSEPETAAVLPPFLLGTHWAQSVGSLWRRAGRAGARARNQGGGVQAGGGSAHGRALQRTQPAE